MTGTETDPQAPRFPYVAALLCAACVGAAAWTWMVYSYCWDVTPDELVERGQGFPKPSKWLWMYVRVRTEPGVGWHRFPAGLPDPTPVAVYEPFLRKEAIRVDGSTQKTSYHYTHETFCVSGPEARDPYHMRLRSDWTGRVIQLGGYACGRVVVDTTASRFHGASIAGLAVGAMGVFVFTVALRHWFGERRAFGEAA